MSKILIKEKTCKKCGINKLICDFENIKNYTRNTCKECRKIYNKYKGYTKKKGEYIKTYREKLKETTGTQTLNRDYVYDMLYAAKNRANKKKLIFNLTREDIVIPEYCPLLNIKLEFGGDSWNSPSLDRIDSSLGYTNDNIQIISTKANIIKSNATIDELLLFSKNFMDLFGIKNHLEGGV